MNKNVNNLKIQLVASIVIPKIHHILMRKNKSYAKNVLKIYKSQIQRYMTKMELK